jgi:hypothetical protein
MSSPPPRLRTMDTNCLHSPPTNMHLRNKDIMNLEYPLLLKSLQGRVRLIDFIRMFYSRLFSSKRSNSPNDVHLNYAELIDTQQEYTYHIWNRYKAVPSFRDSIKIVNFHDGHIVKAFYCDVLCAERGRASWKQRDLIKVQYLVCRVGHWSALDE